MNIPDISILMPMHNTEKYVENTVKSILRQTFTNFELLALNDGSTDKTLNIVKQFNDPRIRLFDLPHDYIGTLNKGLEESTGKYIVRMDSDDYMYPYRLQKQFHFMESNPEIDVCSGAAQCYGSRTDLLECNTNHTDLAITLLYETALIHGTAIIRRQTIIDNNISYNKEFLYAEDYKLWTDFVIAGCKLSSTSDIVIDYNCHPQQTVQTQSNLMWKNAIKTRLYYIEHVINLIIGENEEMYAFMKKLCTIAKENNSNVIDNPFIGIIEFLYKKHLTDE